jgi:hypothetical protein
LRRVSEDEACHQQGCGDARPEDHPAAGIPRCGRHSEG